MKTRTLPIWIPGLALIAAWLPVGLAQNATNRPSLSPPEATPFSMPVPAATNPIPPTTPSAPKIHLSPWTTEIVKLAQVGTDENVMLSFIDNSGMFNLGADQIIYLSDLGISSEVISEMLRHDAEVIAGVRRLTISSDPPQDSSIHVTLAADSSASAKPNAQTATKSALPTPVKSQLAAMPDQKLLPEANTTATDSVLKFALMNDTALVEPEASSQQRQSDGKRGIYRVREPYPVQLTAPIILVQAAERVPNTIVIEWFPKTDER